MFFPSGNENGINGVLGMLLSVPLVSIIYSIVKTDVNLKLNKKNTSG